MKDCQYKNKNMSNKTFYKLLPLEIKTILILSEGWLVGSSIKSLLESRPANDYDIVIPNRECFQNALLYLKGLGNVEITTFGGMKLKTDKMIIDIWCEELGHFLQSSLDQTYIFNLTKQMLFKSE